EPPGLVDNAASIGTRGKKSFATEGHAQASGTFGAVFGCRGCRDDCRRFRLGVEKPRSDTTFASARHPAGLQAALTIRKCSTWNIRLPVRRKMFHVEHFRST